MMLLRVFKTIVIRFQVGFRCSKMHQRQYKQVKDSVWSSKTVVGCKRPQLFTGRPSGRSVRVDERRQYSDVQVDDYDYDDDHDDEDDDDFDDDYDDGENDEDTMLRLNDITGSSYLNIWYCSVLLRAPLITSSSLCFSIPANFWRLELSDV